MYVFFKGTDYISKLASATTQKNIIQPYSSS